MKSKKEIECLIDKMIDMIPPAIKGEYHCLVVGAQTKKIIGDSYKGIEVVTGLVVPEDKVWLQKDKPTELDKI